MRPRALVLLVLVACLVGLGGWLVFGSRNQPGALPAQNSPAQAPPAPRAGAEAALEAALEEPEGAPPGRDSVPLPGADSVAGDVRPVAEFAPALVGRVHDEQGRPIARFELTLVPRSQPESKPGPEDVLRRKCEDAEGRFAVEGLAPGPWSLSVASPGYLCAGEPPPLVLPRAEPLEIGMLRGASVSGRVEDASGAPLPKAKVRAGDSPQLFGRSGGARDTISDESGAFRFETLPAGSLTLQANAKGTAGSPILALRLEPGQVLAGVVLRMRRGGSVTGEVRGVDVTALSRQEVGAILVAEAVQQSTKLDEQGRFRFENLAPGRWQFLLEGRESRVKQKDGQLLLSASCEVVEGLESHVVLGGTPEGAVRVHGRVTRAGQPVATWMIAAFQEGQPALGSLKTAKTDADGRYELELGGPGTYSFVLGRRMGDRDSLELARDIGPAAEQTLDFALPSASVRVRVLAADGAPLAGQDVGLSRTGGFLELASPGIGRSQQSDADGRVVFAGLARGCYLLGAGGVVAETGPGDRTGRVVRALEITGDEQSLEIELRLEPECSIEARIVDADGRPVAGVYLFARDARGELVMRLAKIASDLTGRARLEHLAPGSYTLLARSGELAAAESAPLEARPGEVAVAELRVERGTVLKVDFVDAQGARAFGEVRVFDAAGRDAGATMLAQDLSAAIDEGSFGTRTRFGPLARGVYTVRARRPDGREATETIALTGEAERALTLRYGVR